MESSAESPEPPQQGGSASAAALACNSCRRRKLRCSRELPTCHQCRRAASDCTYESKKGKPGMKAGSIETLHRRLDALERKIEENGHGVGQAQAIEQPALGTARIDPHDGDSAHQRHAYDILSFFAKELQRFSESESGGSAREPHATPSALYAAQRGKRRRFNDDDSAAPSSSTFSQSPLMSDGTLNAVLRVYFSHVHPWIPMIHEGRLRKRLYDDRERDKLDVVLNAVILVASRYVQGSDAHFQPPTPEQSVRVRDHIVSTAMKRLSVENLQALVIVVFYDIGNGYASQAWSLVASLTRTVEYLQLTSENDGVERDTLCNPYISLAPPQDWTEAEERRRVFWNVFLLDRFCSATTGWSTSLTSEDVHRRLPCDGISWRKEDPVTTPYLGIWDKSAGRIGNPIAFLPSHYSAAPLPQTVADTSIQTPSDAGTSSDVPPSTNIDMSGVGAFAYCIEATESLSRVSTYFLQQKASLRDPRDLSSWLTRFKELDLRLVHWKMLLPQKWKATMARQSKQMDPNLTVAHVTHNTSMILLHQLMAFPPLHWPFRSRLPSLLSADTCQSAAVEIATISENYLHFAPPTLPVSNQFAFCVFIAARVLLVTWQHQRTISAVGLSHEFWSLRQSLDEMAKRWAGPGDAKLAESCLAARYSKTLMQLYVSCRDNEAAHIDVTGYTSEINHVEDMTALDQDENGSDGEEQSSQINVNITTDLNSIRDQNGLSSNQAQEVFVNVAPLRSLPTSGILAHSGLGRDSSTREREADELPKMNLGGDDLGSISHTLLDQQFMDMDRVISYQDGMFGVGYDGGGW